MAEELGDDDEIGASTYECGGERVSEDVGGDVVIESGAVGDAGDDAVDGLYAEASPTLAEKQRRVLFGVGPVGAFVKPAGDRRAQLSVDGYFADPFAFAIDPQDAFAGGDAEVVDVEASDLADPGASVERYERDSLVARRRAGLDGPQVPDLRTLVEGPGR